MATVCSQCGKEVTEDHFDVKETNKGNRNMCPETGKFAKLIDKETFERRGSEGGKPLDRFSARVKDKYNFILNWIESGPLGISKDSKGTNYLKEKLENNPTAVDDKEKLRYWISDLTDVHEIALQEALDKMDEIDEEYGQEPKKPSKSKEEGELRQEFKQMKQEMKQDEASQMEKIAKAKFFNKAEKVVDGVQPVLNLIQMFQEEIRRDPELKKAVIEALGADQFKKLIKTTAESAAERRQKTQKEAEEESEGAPTPDERVQEAIDAAKEKAKEEETQSQGQEEEILEEIE